MTVLAHPTLLSRPTLANDLAKRLGGVWEVNYRPTGGFCRLVKVEAMQHKVADLAAARILHNIFGALNLTDPNGPRAA